MARVGMVIQCMNRSHRVYGIAEVRQQMHYERFRPWRPSPIAVCVSGEDEVTDVPLWIASMIFSRPNNELRLEALREYKHSIGKVGESCG